MNPCFALEFDDDWLDDDEMEEAESLGQLFIRNPVTGSYTEIDAAHLPHFVALYERLDDPLN
jgi:hypothetical protein